MSYEHDVAVGSRERDIGRARGSSQDENAMVKILRALESTDGEKGGWWTIFPRSGMDSTGRPCKKNDYVV